MTFRCWAALACVVALLGTSANAGEPAKRAPNVVFILMDDLGHADLGCTGAKDIRTPNIDRIAAEGVRLATFYSNAPVCTPTRAAFLTGRYQQRVGLEWALGFTAEQFRREGNGWVPEPDKLKPGLPTSEPTIARLLRARGYRCGIFGKWHLGFRPEHNPLRHGFDEYFGVLTGHADYYRHQYFDGTPVLREGETPVKVDGYLTDLISDRAVAFVKANRDRPFFLYVPHLAVHFPFQPPGRPDPAITKENYNDGTRRDYAAMLERADDGVGRLLRTLDELKLADDTIVAFSSDNGGYRLSDNTPFFHHKSTLWEGGVRVPCLIRWPAKLPRGQVSATPGITMDLTATFLAAAGVKSERPLDGIDLVPAILGKTPDVERTFCWRVDRSDRKQKAVRQGRWKYVKDGMIELLFNLSTDPGERVNLAYRHADVVVRLRQALAAWEADIDRTPPAIVVK